MNRANLLHYVLPHSRHISGPDRPQVSLMRESLGLSQNLDFSPLKNSLFGNNYTTPKQKLTIVSFKETHRNLRPGSAVKAS